MHFRPYAVNISSLFSQCNARSSKLEHRGELGLLFDHHLSVSDVLGSNTDLRFQNGLVKAAKSRESHSELLDLTLPIATVASPS